MAPCDRDIDGYRLGFYMEIVTRSLLSTALTKGVWGMESKHFCTQNERYEVREREKHYNLVLVFLLGMKMHKFVSSKKIYESSP
jgi:hypothetical protein